MSVSVTATLPLADTVYRISTLLPAGGSLFSYVSVDLTGFEAPDGGAGSNTADILIGDINVSPTNFAYKISPGGVVSLPARGEKTRIDLTQWYARSATINQRLNVAGV